MKRFVDSFQPPESPDFNGLLTRRFPTVSYALAHFGHGEEIARDQETVERRG